jgi:hypothetical protein
MSLNEDDHEIPARISAFLAGLAPQKGKVQIAFRFGDFGTGSTYATKAAELLALPPDVLVASCWPTVSALQGAGASTNNIPIVYAGLFDPDKHYNQHDNVTGFVSHEFDDFLCKAWPDLLHKIAPR